MTIKRQELHTSEIYQTSDLALAAVIFLYRPLQAIDRQNVRKSQFIFDHDNELDELVENYWRGQLRVEPQAYFNALRAIKTRLYQEED